eukprot:CAMPEP_0171261328 /NCGR_PEP_ID=MMETSP0790-20130122/55935_1 /TAXON_ID=2925 /ORGANISM="Alexandrium catenella, Strain OF101" /LENGTH=58 /DNA_ID=CAMNT_0011729727 /DNA_START=90 /DNA_END=262 /DNA_ORIENTATION=+
MSSHLAEPIGMRVGPSPAQPAVPGGCSGAVSLIGLLEYSSGSTDGAQGPPAWQAGSET